MFRAASRVLTVLIIVILATMAGVFGFRATVGTADVNAPTTLPGFQVKLFAAGTAAYSHPDSVEVDSYLHYIYVGYQNVTAKDGTDNKTSTIVQYTMDGKVYRTIPVPGHCDGLRLNPVTHMLWASSNEDGNPVLTIINPVTGLTQGYTFPMPTPHGGGYDDMAFVNGNAYIAASNPNFNAAG